MLCAAIIAAAARGIVDARIVGDPGGIDEGLLDQRHRRHLFRHNRPARHARELHIRAGGRLHLGHIEVEGHVGEEASPSSHGRSAAGEGRAVIRGATHLAVVATSMADGATTAAVVVLAAAREAELRAVAAAMAIVFLLPSISKIIVAAAHCPYPVFVFPCALLQNYIIIEKSMRGMFVTKMGSTCFA